MQAGNLKLAGATIALAALVTGCSEPATNDSSEPSFPRANVTVPNGQFAACKFTVLPGTETLDGTYSSGTVALTVNGQKIGGDSLVEWPTGTQCRFYTLPAGTDLTVALTETPTSGSALYFWRYLINDAAQDPYTRFVPGGATPSPFTMTVTGVNAANNYQIYLKNVPFTPPPPPPSGGCTFTQGYWKTHSAAGPAPYDDGWKNLPGGLEHNTIFFTSGKTWLALWNTPPRGSAYIQLAHQYMAAKLNVLNGASAPSSVTSAISAAEAYFTSGTGNITGLASTLGSYNEGLIGPGHCD